jgi:hypothetical protein
MDLGQKKKRKQNLEGTDTLITKFYIINGYTIVLP